MTLAIDDLKVVFENSPIPGISKMQSAFFGSDNITGNTENFARI